MMRRHPDWLKVRIGGGKNFSKVKTLLRSVKLHTICEEARCPNIAECFGCGTAVFLILGNVCTRDCRYCNVTHGTPSSLNDNEPRDIAESVKTLGLKYVVVTSVTRDDLKDGGASIFYKTVREIRRLNDACKIEVLIPDFRGDEKAVQKVVDAAPDVINHNIEVVEKLFPLIRPQGDYRRSLVVLKTIKKMDGRIPTKSGFMVGLGETNEQTLQTMRDLRVADVDFLTMGQYLQPTRNHVEVKKYYTPEEFVELKNTALQLDFSHVESGPLVRSSYHAQNALQ
ncbi:MAG: lipoyl synthase [Thermoplasmata archaeon]|nr:lipoyl synthase [Thermoplasmata archaeon]MBE3140941.1 lipoyl synthase [Thermoplasmata archaeon]